MNIQELKTIGLTEGEIRIYNALLELGETTRTELAKKSRVSPSKVYDVADRLRKKGIISSVKKNGVLHFSAANPEKIKVFLEQKEKDIKKEKELVNKLLPELLTKYKKIEEETDVEVFYGWEGMKTVYTDIAKKLKPGEFNYIFGASSGVNSDRADIFFTQQYREKRQSGFATKIIFNEDMRKNKQRTSIFKEKPNEIKFLKQKTFTELNVYKNTVLFIMLLNTPMIIRVRNKEAAKSFKDYFNNLWRIAKP